MILTSYTRGTSVGVNGRQYLLPIGWPRQQGNGKRPVVVHHGRGSGALQMIEDFGARLFREIVLAGHPVITSDQGGPTTWGNPSSRSRTYEIQGEICMYAGVDPGTTKCHHLGFSMGGASACSYARAAEEDGSRQVQSLGLVVPALDVQAIYDGGAYTAEIDAAHGGDWAAAAPTHDPAEFIPDLEGIPMKVWYASNDEAAITASQEAFLAARPETESVNLGAVGHTGVEAIAEGDLSAFFDEHD